MSALIFKDLTAPGYFDFSANQSELTEQFSTAWNNYFDYISEQQDLFNDIFRNWINRDYSSVTVARTPFILYQLKQCGMAWFRGNENQAAKLAAFIQGGFDVNTVTNIVSIFTLLSASPFLWCVLNSLQITFGIQVPAYLSEALVIYSDSVSLPATPDPSVYVERDWTAPDDWTKFPESATYISYGALDEYGMIIWSDAYSVSDIAYYYRANLSSMPSANAGDVTLVNDDGTDDVTACYFYDGADWYKFTTPYSNQGQVSDGVPSDPSQSVVAAPDPDSIPYPISSLEPPPVSGPSKGYGIYAGLSDSIISANAITIKITMLEAGLDYLAIFVNLLRRIKPTLNRLFLVYTYDSVQTLIEIHDTGEQI